MQTSLWLTWLRLWPASTILNFCSRRLVVCRTVHFVLVAPAFSLSQIGPRGLTTFGTRRLRGAWVFVCYKELPPPFIFGSAGKNRKPPSATRFSVTNPQVANAQNRGLVCRSWFFTALPETPDESMRQSLDMPTTPYSDNASTCDFFS